MRNAYILTAIGASTLVGFVVVKLIRKNVEHNHTLLEDAGIPDQLDDQDLAQASKADMVSEGSVYGVQYYNEVKEEEPAEEAKS